MTVYGDFVEYTCDIGYEWHGRRIRYCNQLTGKWSGQPTTCEKCTWLGSHAHIVCVRIMIGIVPCLHSKH